MLKGSSSNQKVSLSDAFKQGAWCPLLGGFLIHLTLGTMYCWASNTSYITSAFREHNKSITYSSTFPTYIGGMVGQGLLLPFGGFLERKIGPRNTIFVGASVLVTGTLLTWPAIESDSLILLFLSGGFLFGAGCGICYTAPMVCAYRWLPQHKGIVTGIIVAGYGGGALIFDQVSTAFVNPSNVAVQSGDDDGIDDDEWTDYINCDDHQDGDHGGGHGVCKRASSLYLLLGLCFFLLTFCGANLLINPNDHYTPPRASFRVKSMDFLPFFDDNDDDDDDNNDEDIDEIKKEEIMNKKQKKNDNDDNDLMIKNNIHESLIVQTDYENKMFEENNEYDQYDNHLIVSSHYPQSLKQLIATAMCKFCIFSFIFTATPGVFIAGSYKAIAVLYFDNDRYLTNVGSGGSFGNLTGRLFWGWSCDKFGWQCSILTLSSFMSFLLLTYRMVAILKSTFLFALWTALIYFNYGGNFAIYPYIVADIFGKERVGVNYGFIFMVFGLTSAGALVILTFEISDSSPALTYVLGIAQGFGTLLAFIMSKTHSAQLRALKKKSKTFNQPTLAS